MCIHVLLQGDRERDRAKYRDMELACTARKCQYLLASRAVLLAGAKKRCTGVDKRAL